MRREAEVVRKTAETEVRLYLNLDGSGVSEIVTGYPFLDHMLTLFSHHGFFDLKVKAKGDIQVDVHHLVEDVGISLGRAFSQAAGDRRGIRRYGFAIVPMDEVLVRCAVDISGRGVFVFRLDCERELRNRIKESFGDFFRGFCSAGGVTLHLNVLYGEGYHHVVEALFKCFGLSLERAVKLEERRKTVPSTKGYIEEV